MRHRKERRVLLRSILFWLLAASAVCAQRKPEPKPSPTPEPLPPNSEKIVIRTKSSEQKELPVVVRWPKGFDPKQENSQSGKTHRVLLLCPFAPEIGERAIKRNSALMKLADQRGWFVVSPSFEFFRDKVRDPKVSYYYPEAWSGAAILEALEQVKSKYPVDTHNLFIQGLSGGAQFAHRFAQWAPERVTAVSVNSSGWFEEPLKTAPQVAWLITVGEADPILPESERFTQEINKLGVASILRTYPGMIHEDSAQVNRLTGVFFSYWDEKTKDRVGKDPKDLPPWNPNNLTQYPLLGDSRDRLYYANTEENQAFIEPEYRMHLPTKQIADLWGTPGEEP